MDVIFTLLITLVGIISPPQEKIISEVTLCNFPLSRNIKVANANFNIIYSFEIDEEGRPSNTIKLKDEHVGEAAVGSCLKGWRFHGVQKGARMVVIFQWQHGDGWTEASISGPNISQKIRVFGERCPYSQIQAQGCQ